MPTRVLTGTYFEGESSYRFELPDNWWDEVAQRGVRFSVGPLPDVQGNAVGVKVVTTRRGDEEAVHRLNREAQLLQMIGNTHAASAHLGKGIGSGDDNVLIRWFGTFKPLWPKSLGSNGAAVVGSQLFGAIATLSALGITHRDVKPDNVLLSRDRDQCILVDLSHAYHPSLPTITADREVPGTVPWMAREQESKGLTSEKSDVFSAMLALIYAVTGRNVREFVMRTGGDEQSTLPVELGVPGWLQPYAAQALAHDPDSRPLAEELADAMQLASQRANEDKLVVSAPAVGSSSIETAYYVPSADAQAKFRSDREEHRRFSEVRGNPQRWPTAPGDAHRLQGDRTEEKARDWRDWIGSVATRLGQWIEDSPLNRPIVLLALACIALLFILTILALVASWFR